MTVIAAILALSLLAVVIAFLHHIRRLEHAWTIERRELVNRVQAPDRLPYMPSADFHAPTPEPDESGLVGTISYDGTEGD